MIRKGALPEFQEFLLLNKLAQEKNVLFLAIWASKFLSFCNEKGQQDIGHKSLEMTMIYTHVLRNMSSAPESPLDTLYAGNKS
jgi:hypothetical protein